MPLDDKELLITMINKQNDKNRPVDNEGGLLKFSIKATIFMVLFGVLVATLGKLGLLIWIVLFIIYVAIYYIRLSSNNSKNIRKNSNSKGKLYTCANCGHSFRGLAEKCPKCGITFNLNKPESEREHTCLKCGYKFKGRLDKCPNCGRKLLY